MKVNNHFLLSVNNTQIWIKIVSVLLLGLVIIWWAVADAAPDFREYEAGDERKQAFFDYFLPLIDDHNIAILKKREKIKEWHQNKDNMGWLDQFKLDNFLELYQLDNFDINDDKDWHLLLRRVDVVPASLALAQAVKESGWGTSRFGREGNNFYGQWCFEEGCGLVPLKRGAEQTHEVAVFNSPGESVESYLRNLNSHKAYTPLRKIRAKLRAEDRPITGTELAQGLGKYSERGDAYIKELRSIIRHNNLTEYDDLENRE